MSRGRLLTIREAAERTGHKEATWRAWVLHRSVPFYRIGRSIRLAEADVDELIESGRVPARERSRGGR